MSMEQIRTDSVAVAIVQDDDRSYQVGTISRSSRERPVATAAIRSIDRFTAFGCLGVDDLPVPGTGRAAAAARRTFPAGSFGGRFLREVIRNSFEITGLPFAPRVIMVATTRPQPSLVMPRPRTTVADGMFRRLAAPYRGREHRANGCLCENSGGGQEERAGMQLGAKRSIDPGQVHCSKRLIILHATLFCI